MIFDAHADILTDLHQEAKKGNHESFRTRHLDAYKRAGITHSIFVNWTDPKQNNAHLFQEIFHHALREIHQMQDLFHIVRTCDDMSLSIEKNKIGVILGIEGLAQLEDVNQLRELYQKGIRHASLTWNEVNRYAGGLSSDTAGLTLLGKELLEEMQRLGMIVDLAHANPISFEEILNHTTGPIIVSHGNAKALCSHIRNYTDDQMISIRDRGGVLGICAIAPFLSDNPEEWTVTMMAKHIDYAVHVMGIDHVGVGFDVCYYLGDQVTSNRVDGFQTIGDAQNVFTELAKLGYNEREIQKIKYDNFARIVQQILR